MNSFFGEPDGMSQSDLDKLALQWARSDIHDVLFAEMPHAQFVVLQGYVRSKGGIIKSERRYQTREKIQKAINNYMPEGTIPEWFDDTFPFVYHEMRRLRALRMLPRDALATLKANHYRDGAGFAGHHLWQIGALRPDGSRITLDDKKKFLENIKEIYNNAIEKEAANKITKAAHKKLARMAEPGGSSYLEAMQRFRYRQGKEIVKRRQKKRKNKKKKKGQSLIWNVTLPKKVYSAPSVGLVNWNPRAVPGKAHIGGKKRKNKKGGSKCGCKTRRKGGKRRAVRRKTYKR